MSAEHPRNGAGSPTSQGRRFEVPKQDQPVASANGHRPAVADQPGDVWDQRVASGLAFLRRRLAGDYDVDEFGFDPELTDTVFFPMLRLLYRDWFRTEVSGTRAPAARRRGPGGRQPLRHHRPRRDDPRRGPARPAPDQPPPAAARRGPGLPDALRLRDRPQDRRHRRLQRRRRTAAARRRTGGRLPGGLQGHRQALLRALQAAALRPGRVRRRRRCAPAPRSCRWRSSAPRRSIR